MEANFNRAAFSAFYWRGAAFIAGVFCLAAAPQATFAQSMGGDSASASANVMWGTTPGGSGFVSPLESAVLHETNALIAGQALAAENGTLGAVGSSITIQSIGSQTVISNTVIGNGNEANITADQKSSNTGDVTNTGDLKGMIINNNQ